MKTKLFIVAFGISFTLTAVLCIATKQPLIFFPIDYGFAEFIKFGLLIGALCFSLVLISLPFLRFIKKLTWTNIREGAFYIIGILILLQVVTLVTGYVESSLTTHTADIFYYYKGVSNSLLYILTGNLTAIIIASLYAKEQTRLKKIAEPKFDFDSGTN